MSSASEPTWKQRAAALALVASFLAGVVVIVESLPPEQVRFWFGTVVDHCPDSELSCTSTRPGAGLLVLAPVVLLIMYFEDPDE